MSLSFCRLLTISDSNPTLCGSRPKRICSIPSIRRKLPTLVVAKVRSTPIDQSILHGLIPQTIGRRVSPTTALDSPSASRHTPPAWNRITRMSAQRTSSASRQSITQPGSSPEFLEQIRVRAYELFEQRGREAGHEVEDWLKAEAEVLQKTSKTTAA